MSAQNLESIWPVIATLSGAGMIGGFIRSLRKDDREARNTLRPGGGRSYDIGMWGDMLIGAVTGVAVFYLMAALVGADFVNLARPEAYLRMIAVGVLSGFGGYHLLEAILNVFLQQLVKDVDKLKAGMEIQKIESRIAERLDIAHNYMISARQLKQAGLLGEAMRIVAEVLQERPDNVRALGFKAYIADEHGRHDEAEKIYRHILATIPEHDPDRYKYEYNLACVLAQKPDADAHSSDIVAHLRRALERQPRLVRESLPQEFSGEFRNVVKAPWFLELLVEFGVEGAPDSPSPKQNAPGAGTNPGSGGDVGEKK